MIVKLLKLQGIGLLHDALDARLNNGARGLALGRLTVIYGENGRGKSTLAAILRSLSTGETSIIEERKTIGGQHSPNVSLLVGNRQINFSQNKWVDRRPSVVVFDTQFVESNVYSGMSIGPDQRKNLLDFALGEAGVRLAQNVDALNVEARKLGEQIAIAERNVALLTLSGFPVEAFVVLEERQDVGDEVERARKLWESMQQAQSILERALLVTLDVPYLSRQQAEAVLASSLASLSSSVEASVRHHNDLHLQGKGEQWLKRGMDFQTESLCPYCGQDMSSAGLVKAYGAFFSGEYAALKKQIEAQRVDCARLLSEKKLMEIIHIDEKNRESASFWKSHADFEMPSSPVPRLESAWNSLFVALDGALLRKAASPLEDTGTLSSVAACFEAFEDAINQVRDFNEAVSRANDIIEAFKDGLAGQVTGEVDLALKTALNRMARWTPEGNAASQRLLELRRRKLEVEAEKARAKDELNQYTKTELVSYQHSINSYLQRCGTGFKIEEVKPAYGGGTPRSDYKINVRASQVSISEQVTGGQSSPTFRTALSDGDKRTLAFAFFVSRLKDGADTGNKIVVFDDPIVSFDAHRRNLCIRTISQIYGTCAQVIVLTHDPVFAKSLSLEFNAPDLCSLKIRRQGDFSIIEPCDLAVECADSHTKNYTRLYEYLKKGPEEELIDIARCVRPLLEGHLRSRFPGRFRDEDTLGKMIAQIREAAADDRLRIMAGHLSNIAEIDDYVVQFHHDADPLLGYDITESELRQYAQRTIDLVHGVSPAA